MLVEGDWHLAKPQKLKIQSINPLETDSKSIFYTKIPSHSWLLQQKLLHHTFFQSLTQKYQQSTKESLKIESNQLPTNINSRKSAGNQWKTYDPKQTNPISKNSKLKNHADMSNVNCILMHLLKRLYIIVIICTKEKREKTSLRH